MFRVNTFIFLPDMMDATQSRREKCARDPHFKKALLRERFAVGHGRLSALVEGR
jgi:hypothetical protein